MLPPDDHVHSEWSWDTLTGNMERTCARAVEIGLPSVAFTEHVDFAPYVFDETHMPYMPECVPAPHGRRHGVAPPGHRRGRLPREHRALP